MGYYDGGAFLGDPETGGGRNGDLAANGLHIDAPGTSDNRAESAKDVGIALESEFDNGTWFFHIINSMVQR